MEILIRGVGGGGEDTNAPILPKKKNLTYQNCFPPNQEFPIPWGVGEVGWLVCL